MHRTADRPDHANDPTAPHLMWQGVWVPLPKVLRDNPEPIPVGDATVLHITRADLRAAFDATFIAPMRAAEAELWHALAKRQPATHREPA